jgi:hypothetical protein
MDNLGLIELFHEFTEFVMGAKVEKPTIYQDCTAVISLVTKGGGFTRTKHLHARMNLGRELVDEKRGIVVYQPVAGMIADGFSKAYDPAEHKIFARKIQGEERITDIKVQTMGGH